MTLRNGLIACLCTMALVFSGLSAADEYRADDFLALDLSKAVLSPRPLGPASAFVQAPPRVAADQGGSRGQSKREPAAHSKVAVDGATSLSSGIQPPRLLARTRTAHPHGHAGDAPPVQVWPCKSGGICSWRR